MTNQKTNFKTRTLAAFLCLVMLFTMVPIMPAYAAPATENTNQEDGVVIKKSATPKADGTVDIVIDAYTTGDVVSQSVITPTDIVLVLDVSGSMDDRQTSSTRYEEVLGSTWTSYGTTYYGLSQNSGTYFIYDGETYREVSYVGTSNRVSYYRYTGADSQNHYVYPIMEEGINRAPNNSNYTQVQFYARPKKITNMRNAVDQFIDTTLTMNEGIEDAADKHRIAIVKYASNSYYSASTGAISNIDNAQNSTIGDDKNSSGYNYTQLVTGFTVVDTAGDASLKASVDALTPGGATAIDYGLTMAISALETNRTAEEKAKRNEVVVLFTDGQPTHSSSFSTDVANTAISRALALKNSGTSVYSISVLNTADSTTTADNTNKFMHYVSSNYPSAQSLSDAGTGGNINGGYYMTPTGGLTLSEIFDSIIQNIGKPTITLGGEGSEVAVVDTLSKYFDLTDVTTPISNVKVETVDKTVDGWAEPVLAGSEITAVVSSDNRQIEVLGFNFDENHISTEARDGNFYGRKLRITINTTPNYDAIDAMSPRGAEVETNHETEHAKIVHSVHGVVAETLSPTVVMNKISYVVDGQSFSEGSFDVYRLPGSDNTTIFEPAKEGHIFSGWTSEDVTLGSDGSFTMPEQDVVIEGTFTAKTYNIEYTYEGTLPEGVSPTDPSVHNEQNVAYGTNKNVAALPTTPAGYTFSGWKTGDATVDAGEFTMPANNVRFVGSFVANANTKYRVEHYSQNIDDETQYTLIEGYDHFDKTGEQASARPNEYLGFTFDKTKTETENGMALGTDNELTGVIAGDGSLVLKFYYGRNSYDVSYRYIGTIPLEAHQVPFLKTYKYGQNVTVADAATAAGYTFRGWSSSQVSETNGETFKMPAMNVVFEGSFTANGDTPFKIEHYLQKLDGTYSDTPDDSYTDKGATGTEVTAEAKSYTGFEYDAATTGEQYKGKIKGDGSLVLKLYYSRKSYNVTYQYEQPIPSDASALPTGGTFKYGQTVTVADKASAEGYDFHGWTSEIVSATNGENFTMPARDVLFTGHFVAHGDTGYKVEHYLENLDGTYPETPNEVKDHTGQTDTEVEAMPIYFEGYLYNASHPDTVKKGTIAGDGSLVLKLYYAREINKVVYEYIGIVPANAPSVPAQQNYKFGATVDVADDAELIGYTFDGWATADKVLVNNNTVSFTMPETDVYLRGMFTPNTNTKYAVEHYVENVEGTDYELELRDDGLTGTTGAKITALPKDFDGFTFDEAVTGTQNEGVIAGDGSTVLKLYYSRDKQVVKYTYIGIVPAGAPALPADETYPFEATVVVKPDAIVAGYTFNGWADIDGLVNKDTETFIMPHEDVQLRGQFVPNTDTQYKVEHYVQQRDGSYKLHTTTTHNDGVTGQKAYAMPIVITGYTYNENHTDNLKEGIVTGDGSLVLKLHYDRHEHKVEYAFTGHVPTGAVVPATEYYIPSENVDVAVIAVPAGYTFTGWTSYGGAVQPSDTSFIMPDRDVHLTGSFSANDADYTVEHWLQNLEDDDYTEKVEDRRVITSKTDATVVARTNTYEGFTFNVSLSNWEGVVKHDGSLVLKFYYDRNVYPVTYSYFGVQPEGAPDIPYAAENFKYGAEVTVKDKLTMQGYTFLGWNSMQVVQEEGKFTMPNQAVNLTGYFVPNEDTPYKVEHYVQKSGSTYELHTVEDFTGTTGQSVTAEKITISGYKFYEGHADTLKEGIILADGSLVLRLYYKKSGGGGGGGTHTIPTGYLEITKIVKAPENADFDGKEFEFEIFEKINGEEKFVQTLKVKAGETIKGEIDTGTYYIFEKNANVDGYLLEVKCDAQDNMVVVKKNETSAIKFENVYEAKEEMLEKYDHYGYIVGYPDGNVHPEENITRAEAATIFFRMMTDEARKSQHSKESGFDDVKSSNWFNVAISTLVKAEILDSESDTFRPNDDITRAELCKMAAAFYTMKDNGEANFSDIDGHWAEKYIKSAYSYGFIDGYPDGTFKPNQKVTRAEAMKIINRALDRIPDKDNLLPDMIKWPDNSNKNAWFYADVQEATNSHAYDRKDGYEVWTTILPMRDWAALEVTD